MVVPAAGEAFNYSLRGGAEAHLMMTFFFRALSDCNGPLINPQLCIRWGDPGLCLYW